MFHCFFCLLLLKLYISLSLDAVVATQPLLRDEGMAEDHGVHEAGNSPRPGPVIVKR